MDEPHRRTRSFAGSRKDVGKKLTDVFTNPEFIQHIQSERWKARQLIDLPDGRVLEVRVISAGKNTQSS